MDEKDLKIQALREALKDKVSTLVDDYENKIADLRIEITMMSNEIDHLNASLQEARSQGSNEVVEGELID